MADILLVLLILLFSAVGLTNFFNFGKFSFFLYLYALNHASDSKCCILIEFTNGDGVPKVTNIK